MTGLIPTYVYFILAIILSAVISMYAVRKLIFITKQKHIFDIPDNVRKIHGGQIASLGGIGIFAGYLIGASFFIYMEWYYVIAASILLFFTGIYDDIMNMRPSKKLVAQIIASCIAVFLADIRITSLCGIANIGELPYVASAIITVIACTFFINVFNFMDGIDGLACMLAIFYTMVLAVLFAGMGDKNLTGIALSVMGASAGLFVYNKQPAKIYMGDTGSMLLGFTVFALTVSCINIYISGQGNPLMPSVHSSQGLMMMLLAMLFLPVYDALRVFVIRLSKKISPLKADRTHIHYRLLDAGMSHSGAVLVIGLAHVVLLAIVWVLQDVHPFILIGIMTAFSLVLSFVIARIRQKHQHTIA
jgi:UDP-GlcNAc:undecaprenyl-phosphate/decaprenyl-phosphate GlcNAc-1-phosphate transferase